MRSNAVDFGQTGVVLDEVVRTGTGLVRNGPHPLGLSVRRLLSEATLDANDTDLRQRLQKATARADEAERQLADAERHCAALQDEKHQLVGELQHQVRNLLAVVRSVARRSGETSESVEDYAMYLDGRLTALARVHGAMVVDPRAKLGLHTLISDELLSYHAKEGEQVDLSGPRILLQPQAVSPLALAFHELATNAIKFGALTRQEGRINVSWQREDGPEPRLVMTWRERGGPPVSPPERRGFSLTLLERVLPYELQAEVSLDFAPTGLSCTIALPLTARIVAEEANLTN
ncbi:sensor histidine kinase [Methylobacterium nigriterrae]|uniref:sensor histidine kinase n=1 Tax=Methylobacterium nigriterrae TaxID=3127512 RepID=UPI003014141F